MYTEKGKVLAEFSLGESEIRISAEKEKKSSSHFALGYVGTSVRCTHSLTEPILSHSVNPSTIACLFTDVIATPRQVMTNAMCAH